MIQSKKETIEQSAIKLKSSFREIALRNYNTMGELEARVDDLNQFLSRTGCTPESLSPINEIKDGIIKYKKALDDVIRDFS